MAAQLDNASAIAPRIERLDNFRTLLSGKALNIGNEFGIKDILLPRQILARLSDACSCTGEAYLHWHVEEDYRIAAFESLWECVQIIAVDDPMISAQNLFKLCIEFCVCDITAIWLVPDHDEIYER